MFMNEADMQTIHRNGKRFVLVPFEDYQRLTAALPPLPPAAGDGSRDAIEFARASIARRLILERGAVGLSQKQLAKIAGVRQETISRIESGKHTATIRVMDKLQKAIRKAEILPTKKMVG
jgi:DNA-binding XRE family transcriptional regulator